MHKMQFFLFTIENYTTLDTKKSLNFSPVYFFLFQLLYITDNSRRESVSKGDIGCPYTAK